MEERKINRGIYTAVNGLMSRQMQIDIIADNIANVNTVAHKSRNTSFATFHDALIHSVSRNGIQAIGTMPHGSQIAQTTIDFTPGSLTETRAAFDFAIIGEGFFIVDTPDGDMYTRNGSFRIDAEGYLVNVNGYRVIGYYDDFIHVENGVMDQAFAIANPPPETLLRIREGLYSITDPALENLMENPQVQRGFLEASNVDLAQSLAELIEASRMLQLNQRVLMAKDDMSRRSASEIGSLRG